MAIFLNFFALSKIGRSEHTISYEREKQSSFTSLDYIIGINLWYYDNHMLTRTPSVWSLFLKEMEEYCLIIT